MTLTPSSATDVVAAVAEAVATRAPLVLRGLSSKAGIGRPDGNERPLFLAGLTGVTLYEPEELVLSARAGTPVAEIEALLDARGQELAFEPMSFAALHGTGQGTLGGAVMANQSGPRRIKMGAARDHVLGVEAVSGRGELFKAGGRVVKNVTGYDLAKGLCGSWGTLAVATELTVKVLPKAETAATLILSGLEPAAAVKALSAALGSPADVSGAAHLPAAAAARAGFPTAATLIRLEGFEPSVAARFERLAALLKPFAPADRLDGEASAALWRAIRDVAPLAEPADRAIWRVSVAPTAGPSVAAAVTASRPADVLFDWGGGLVWIATEAAGDGGAAAIRSAVAATGGGHATLIRGPAALRESVPVFQPQPAALAALGRRLKAEFDPLGILNPARMAGDA